MGKILIYAISRLPSFSILPFLPGTNHRWYLPFCNLIDIYTDFVHLFIHLLDRGCVGVDDIAVDSHFSKIGSHVSGL